MVLVISTFLLTKKHVCKNECKNECKYECKNPKENDLCKKYIYIWNRTASSCENGKYLGSIIDDSVIMCDGILKETKTIPTKTNPTESTSTHFYSII